MQLKCNSAAGRTRRPGLISRALCRRRFGNTVRLGGRCHRPGPCSTGTAVKCAPLVHRARNPSRCSNARSDSAAYLWGRRSHWSGPHPPRSCPYAAWRYTGPPSETTEHAAFRTVMSTFSRRRRSYDLENSCVPIMRHEIVPEPIVPNHQAPVSSSFSTSSSCHDCSNVPRIGADMLGSRRPKPPDEKPRFTQVSKPALLTVPNRHRLFGAM